MKLEGDGLLLRIFVGDSDRCGGEPLFEAIVRRARERGLAGATVLRGVEGFGAHSRIHTARILRLSQDLPIVVEIVDRAERIEAFLPELDEMVDEGMVTLEKVRILRYRHRDPPSSDPKVDGTSE
jgi:PII-like signaling protein